jgi:hypothetical protein
MAEAKSVLKPPSGPVAERFSEEEKIARSMIEEKMRQIEEVHVPTPIHVKVMMNKPLDLIVAEKVYKMLGRIKEGIATNNKRKLEFIIKPPLLVRISEIVRILNTKLEPAGWVAINSEPRFISVRVKS